MLDFNLISMSHCALLLIGEVLRYMTDEGQEDVLCLQSLVAPAKLQVKHLPAPTVFQSHRITNQLGFEGTAGDHLVRPTC